MRIVVTGAAGFIGSNLCKYLHDDGHEIFALDNAPLSQGWTRNLPYRWVCMDVAEDRWFKHADDFEPDIVLHLAASFANEKSVDFPDTDCRDNVLGTVQVGKFVTRHDIPVIYAGSSSSYGNLEGDAFYETDQVNPSTPYAFSKWAGEEYLRIMGCRGITFRLFNVFGPGDPPAFYRNAIPNMVWKARLTRTVPVFGKDSARDFTPVEVVCHYFGLAIWQDHPTMRLMNLCLGRELNMYDVATLIASKFDAGVEVHERRAWDKVVRRRGSPEKLFKELGPLDISDEEYHNALVRTLDWLGGYELPPL